MPHLRGECDSGKAQAKWLGWTKVDIITIKSSENGVSV